MSVEDRVLRLENAFATLSELAARSESRTDNLAQLTETLVQLAVSASERADTHESWINTLGARTEEHESWINSLNARAEEFAAAQVELTKAQAELSKSQDELSKAQARTEAVVAETNERLNHLTEVVERYISERRNGQF
jgi:uncharacterized phage infection (PIP) family protein YhgE